MLNCKHEYSEPTPTAINGIQYRQCRHCGHGQFHLVSMGWIEPDECGCKSCTPPRPAWLEKLN